MSRIREEVDHAVSTDTELDKIIIEIKEKIDPDIMIDREARVNGLFQLRQLLRGNSKQLEMILKNFLHHFSNIDPPITKVIESGLIETVFRYLQVEDIELRFESTWIVSNAATGSISDVEYLLELGMMERMRQSLYSEHERLLEKTIWAVGNVCGQSSSNVRDFVVNQPEIIKQVVHLSVSKIQALMNQPSPCEDTLDLVRALAWMMHTCCRGRPAPDFDITRQFLPSLLMFLRYPDSELQLHASSAYAFLTEGPARQVREVIRSGFLPIMMTIIQGKDYELEEELLLAVLRVLGNISSRDPARCVVELGGLELLARHLTPLCSPAVKHTACLALSEVVAHSRSEAECVLNHPHLLPRLADLFRDPREGSEVRSSILWLVASITLQGEASFIFQLLEFDLSPGFIAVLSSVDVNAVAICLATIDAVCLCLRENDKFLELEEFRDSLEAHGGMDVIDDLQNSSDRRVSFKAMDVLRGFQEVIEGVEEDGGQEGMVSQG